MVIDINTIRRRADATRNANPNPPAFSDVAVTSLLAMFSEPAQTFVAGQWPGCDVALSLSSLVVNEQAPTELHGSAKVGGVPFEVVVVLDQGDPATFEPRFQRALLRYHPRGDVSSDSFEVAAGDWLGLENAAGLELSAG